MVVLNGGWSTGPYRRPCKELWCPGPEAQQRASPPDKAHAGHQEKRAQMQIKHCDTNSDKNTEIFSPFILVVSGSGCISYLDFYAQMSR